ncbi:MAG: hypothetical protein O3A46_08260 [Candidatus Poribacteria bacterium]|nr:hypothetical protein [Candidatus Poribacteria bacterium]
MRRSVTAAYVRLREDRWWQLVLALTVLHLIPIWAFTYVPTQDGLNHVYNSYILKEWHNPAYTKFHDAYELNLTLFPNWTNYAFFYAALHVVPPVVADKLFLTVCVLLYPLAFGYLLKAVGADARLWGLLGFLFTYHTFIALGFYNFVLSLPMACFALSYWWKRRGDFQLKHAAVLNLGLLAIYLTHFSTYGKVLMAFSILATTGYLLPLLNFRLQLKRLATFYGYLSPSYFLLLSTLLSNPESHNRAWWETKLVGFVHYDSLKVLWEQLLHLKSLVYFNDSYADISHLTIPLLLGGFGWTVVQRIRQRAVKPRDGFLVLTAVLTVAYFALPERYGSPAWINERVLLFAIPMLVAWFEPFPTQGVVWKRVRVGLGAWIIVLSMWHLGYTLRDFGRLSGDMEEFASGAHLIEPNSTVSMFQHDNCSMKAKRHGVLKYASPFFHDSTLYCFGNGSVYVGNYEPKYDYFPIHYREGYWKWEYPSAPIDYWIAWNLPEDDAEVAKLGDDYEVVHRTEQLRLFKRKAP